MRQVHIPSSRQAEVAPGGLPDVSTRWGQIVNQVKNQIKKNSVLRKNSIILNSLDRISLKTLWNLEIAERH